MAPAGSRAHHNRGRKWATPHTVATRKAQRAESRVRVHIASAIPTMARGQIDAWGNARWARNPPTAATNSEVDRRETDTRTEYFTRTPATAPARSGLLRTAGASPSFSNEGVPRRVCSAGTVGNLPA